MTTRVRRLIVAVVSGVIGRAVTLLVPLFVMAPLLDYLGPDLFSVWLTAVALSGMMSFLDLGIGNAALTHLSEAFGRDDLTAVRRILGEAYTLLIAISVASILLMLIGAALVHWLATTKATADQVTVVAIVLVSLFLSFPAGLISRFLQARHAFVQMQLSQVAGPSIALLACLAAIRANLNPVLVIAHYALANGVLMLLWTGVYFAANRDYRPVFRGLDRTSMKSLTALGGAFFVLLILYVIGMNADNVLIGALIGGTAVAEVGVPAKLGSILMMIVGTVFMPLWPLFGDALARRDRAWLMATTRRMSLGGAAGVLAMGLGMTAFVDPIMIVWMGRPFPDQQLILLGWTLVATVIALTAPYNMVLNAAGMAQAQILPWAAFVGISISAKAVLLTAQTAWWAPWITATVYAATITPPMILMALRRLHAVET